MKRIWIGVGVLLILLVVGILVMQITNRQLGKLSENLLLASETLRWEEAISLAKDAKQDWEKKWSLLAALADHTDIDTVDQIFAQLEVYQHRKEETAHAAACAQLAEALDDLKENHRLAWWNLL